MKILVVDDDKDILDALQLLFEELEFEVCVADKGKDAFRMAQEQQPKVILLDVLLSGEDGRDVCRELKARAETSSIPIIMMSAHPSARHTVKEAGAVDFLSKPFDIDNLVKMIEQYVKNPSDSSSKIVP